MDIKKIAEDLIGTTDKDPTELSKMTIDELIEFESIAVKCSSCGFWVEPNDMSDCEEEPLCMECEE